MRRKLSLSRLRGCAESSRGLSAAEVEARRRLHGRNDILEAPPSGWSDVLRDTATDPMIWFLIGTSALYAFLAQYLESLALLIATVPLMGMDAFLHRRTQASTQGLRSQLAEQATVIREGVTTTIPADDLVPGDLTVVALGEPFPADGIIVAGEDLQVEESALTGEAYPVSKRPLQAIPPAPAEPIIDASHWGFAGTRLLTGRARMRVVYTGSETLYGEIVHSALQGRHARTPLQRALADLLSVLVLAAALACIALAGVRLGQGHGLVDALLSAVTLAVAALPEEFPVVFTVYLGIGIYRLAQQRALVRRAAVVENIGRVTTICSDKTGTITEGRLSLARLYPARGVDEQRLLTLAAHASRRESEDPLDLAILAAGGADVSAERLATFPFTEDRGRETSITRSSAGGYLVTVKGAPESVLAMATLTPEQRSVWQALSGNLAGAGHKTIACAWRELGNWTDSEPTQDYAFAGLLTFHDPIREGVAEAIGQCRGAGIRILMVTGDHPETARAIAAEAGLGNGSPRVIRADHLLARMQQEGGTCIHEVDVVARAIPSQKLALIQALQSSGEIVAVTGDGVNDVPALQAADIGVAMGERGTRSAREVATIVLLDDNFRTIVRAIAEGQQLFANLRTSFAYLLMIHIPLVLTAALIPLAGFPLLYLPAHIVWIELIIHPTALLAFQDIANREHLLPVRKTSHRHFFKPQEWLVIGLAGIFITGAIVWIYGRGFSADANVEHARTMALVILSTSSAALTAIMSRLRTHAASIMVAVTIGLAVLLVQLPAIAVQLHLTPLDLGSWGLAVLTCFLASIPSIFVSSRRGL